MIINKNFFNNIKTNTIGKIHKRINNFKFDMPKLKQLKQDIFELREGMPEFLLYNPQVCKRNFNSGIKDYRFSLLNTEYRAYDYEGKSTKFPNRYVCIDPDGKRRLKPHIYISIIEVRPEYARQGAYKSTIKKLAEIIKYDEECEGRMILDSRKIEGVFVTKIPSPSLAHWNSGFRFVNEEDNKIMKDVLEGKLPPEDAPEGIMYYSLA